MTDEGGRMKDESDAIQTCAVQLEMNPSALIASLSSFILPPSSLLSNFYEPKRKR
jgi:hypothetical protein